MTARLEQVIRQNLARLGYDLSMPPKLDTLRDRFREKAYLLTSHASDRAAQRGILSREIEEAVIGGEMIEDYADDKYRAQAAL